ncbi:MAG: hypothetical protein J6S01_04680 [Bacteroidales bacterium]|nr:hypothetical protein [Bacteroidales bacterium]
MNKKFHYPFLLLLGAAIAVGCTKDQGTGDEVPGNQQKSQYELAEWSDVQENQVSKERFFSELEEDVVFPEKGEYKFNSCKDNIISGTVKAVLLPEGTVEGTDAESKTPRLLAVQIGLNEIPYSVSESTATLDSKDNSVKVSFIDTEWDTAYSTKATGTLIVSGEMDLEAMLNNGEIPCNLTLHLKLSDGERLKFHFTELTPGTPFSMN